MKLALPSAFVAFAAFTACSAGHQDLGNTNPDAGNHPAPSTTSGAASSAESAADAGAHTPAADGGAGPGRTPDPTSRSNDPSSRKRVFVTSTAYDGALGGLSGADAKCMLAAQTAGLEGTFRAWLSDHATDAIDRIADVSPWYLVDRTTKVFANKTSLMTTALAGVDKDESGRTVGLPVAWSGTDKGRATASTCLNWTTNEFAAPSPLGTTVDAWTWKTSLNDDICSSDNALICFEQ